MTCVAILTDPVIGGTFVTWTWHWLKNDSSYYHSPSKQHYQLTSDPLTNKNSHKFLTNQATCLTECIDILNDSSINHIYIHKFREEHTAPAIDLVRKHCKKITVITKSPSYALYDCSLAIRSPTATSLFDQRVLTDGYEILYDHLTYYFGENFKLWQQQNLNEIWDLREFIALNDTPLFNNTIRDHYDFDFDCFDISADTVWTSLDTTVGHWFDYCETVLDQKRFEQWIPIYRKWQLLHQDRIKFCKEFDSIIDGILTNKNIDLSQYNLDIVREAAIQHALIYQHNLNLKTWQLEKFTNTQQLYNLLEPSIHPLSS